MSDTDGGNADLTPINLVDCGLEDLVAALLHGQPVAKPTDGALFVQQDDNTWRILSYCTRHP